MAKLGRLSRLGQAAIFAAHGAGADDGASPPQFRDIAEEADLGDRITCGGSVTESLLDVNGQDACFLDYDRDGHLDVYLANGPSRTMDSAGAAPADCSRTRAGNPAEWSTSTESRRAP